MDTLLLIMKIQTELAMMAVTVVQATQANDQATLDAIQVRAVALSNSLRPAGGEDPVAVQ